MSERDEFQAWVRRQREDELHLEKQRWDAYANRRTLQDALDAFDPNWAMLCGDHLTDDDYDFLESCNVSWEYNNEEAK